MTEESSHAAADGDDIPETLPPRTANATQALMAIALVFFFGVLIGFVLARTL